MSKNKEELNKKFKMIDCWPAAMCTAQEPKPEVNDHDNSNQDGNRVSA